MLKTCGYYSSALIFLCLAVIVFFTGCGYDAEDNKTLWGRSDATEVDITSKIPGRLVELLVSEGEQVKKGQVLARIDKRDIAAQIIQAKANIKALQAQKKQASLNTLLQGKTTEAAARNANAQLEKAETDFSLAKSDFHRYSSLLSANAISEQTVDSYRNKLEEAAAAYRQAQANLDSSNAGLLQKNVDQADEENIDEKIEQAQAALKEIEISLDETEIRAPFDGIISSKYVDEGTMMSTGMPIVSVQDPLSNWINMKVKETDLPKYTIGNEVTVVDRSGNLKLNGKIVDVSKKAEFATYRSTSERGGQDIITFNVKIQVNSDQIKPGMQFHIAS
ncbi:HlyD family secretion protein [Pectinatus haikarae]|uniref:HlyD family secretion protein n=1 Tax=Pectinatus haikarae TaxID=349096 RepID=UPI0018C76994|nr:HlyD family efflux transporter periplasmic adaptor subunit [Pectinatus haikarae]